MPTFIRPSSHLQTYHGRAPRNPTPTNHLPPQVVQPSTKTTNHHPQPSQRMLLYSSMLNTCNSCACVRHIIEPCRCRFPVLAQQNGRAVVVAACTLQDMSTRPRRTPTTSAATATMFSSKSPHPPPTRNRTHKHSKNDCMHENGMYVYTTLY